MKSYCYYCLEYLYLVFIISFIFICGIKKNNEISILFCFNYFLIKVIFTSSLLNHIFA